MKTQNSAIIALSLILTACIPSVKPFFTDKDVVQDPHLVGEWLTQPQSGQTEHWTFEATDAGNYKLMVRDNEQKTGKFRATFFKLGAERFLDLVAEECEFAPTQNDLVAASIFPGHLLLHVQLTDSELKLTMFDWDWLEKLLKAQPEVLGHYREDDRLLLTADTGALQKFVLDHLRDGLFDEATTYSRASAPAR